VRGSTGPRNESRLRLSVLSIQRGGGIDEARAEGGGLPRAYSLEGVGGSADEARSKVQREVIRKGIGDREGGEKQRRGVWMQWGGDSALQME